METTERPNERIIISLLGILEAFINALKDKPVRTILKLLALSLFNTLAIGFIVFMSILLAYALYTNTDSYRFNQAKKNLIRKYPDDWRSHLNELKVVDYEISNGRVM